MLKDATSTCLGILMAVTILFVACLELASPDRSHQVPAAAQYHIDRTKAARENMGLRDAELSPSIPPVAPWKVLRLGVDELGMPSAQRVIYSPEVRNSGGPPNNKNALNARLIIGCGRAERVTFYIRQRARRIERVVAVFEGASPREAEGPTTEQAHIIGRVSTDRLVSSNGVTVYAHLAGGDIARFTWNLSNNHRMIASCRRNSPK